jgi:hypothetical protein
MLFMPPIFAGPTYIQLPDHIIPDVIIRRECGTVGIDGPNI